MVPFYISRIEPMTSDRTNRVTTSLVPAELPGPDAYDISEHAMRYFHNLYLTVMKR